MLAKGDVVDAEELPTNSAMTPCGPIAALQASIVEAHNKSLADFRPFAARDLVPEPDTICNMCGRPISPDDLDHTRRHAEQRIAEIDGQIIHLRDEMAQQRRGSRDRYGSVSDPGARKTLTRPGAHCQRKNKISPMRDRMDRRK